MQNPPAAEIFRSGYVAIIGRPNVGKSTFLNAVLGEKIAIISDKPQTTRDRLFGIYTDLHCQMVFVDTPGVIQPQDAFNEYLLHEATEALASVDAVVFMVEANDAEAPPGYALDLLARTQAPTFLVINKIDAAPRGWRPDRHPASLHATMRWEDRFAISALSRNGVDDLLAALRERMPEGPAYYDADQLCDRDLRYLVAERVREKIFQLTHEEIPYGVATRTEEFRERPEQKKTYIAVDILVERESQKGIIVGQNAAMLKKIGQLARPEIEWLVGGPVYLELQVRTSKKWRKDAYALRQLGYAPPKSPKKRP